MSSKFIMIAMIFVTMPGAAHAYVGPGAGLGVVAVTLAVIFGILLLLVGFVWYPMKRMLRRLKSPATAKAATED